MLTLFFTVLLLAGLTRAQTSPGSFLVLDLGAGTNGGGALFSVDPDTGQRTVISDFGDSSQGVLGFGSLLAGLETDIDGNIYVLDVDSGTGVSVEISLGGSIFNEIVVFGGRIIRVSPVTGDRTVVSDFGDSSQGVLSFEPSDMAVDGSGNIIVADIDAGTDGNGLIFSVDPGTGQRTVISDSGDSTQGDLGLNPNGVAVDLSGNILVTDAIAGTDSRGVIFSVNPSTGERTVISDFGDISQGDLGSNPFDIEIGSGGDIFVFNPDSDIPPSDVLFSVDPDTGQRVIVSDLNDSSQGDLGINPFDTAIDSSGNVLVTDLNAGTNLGGVLFSIDPGTGQRTVVSDFGDSTQGVVSSDPDSVAVLSNIDECALAVDDCNENATCTDTEESFICECNEGFAGDGTECSPAPPSASDDNDDTPPPVGDDDDVIDTPLPTDGEDVQDLDVVDNGTSGCNTIVGKSPTTVDFAGAILPFMFISLAVFYRRRRRA